MQRDSLLMGFARALPILRTCRLADFQDDRTRANVLFGLVGVILNTVL